jgi:hypothetical protein
MLEQWTSFSLRLPIEQHGDEPQLSLQYVVGPAPCHRLKQNLFGYTRRAQIEVRYLCPPRTAYMIDSSQLGLIG